MTKSKTTLAVLFGGIMLGTGSAVADEPSMPWFDNPAQYAPDELTVYGEDYSWLRDQSESADSGPTLFAVGDGRTRPWTGNPERYAPDGLSAYSGDHRWLVTYTGEPEQTGPVAVPVAGRDCGTGTALC